MISKFSLMTLLLRVDPLDVVGHFCGDFEEDESFAPYVPLNEYQSEAERILGRLTETMTAEELAEVVAEAFRGDLGDSGQRAFEVAVAILATA
jgi:hypothetical protein